MFPLSIKQTIAIGFGILGIVAISFIVFKNVSKKVSDTPVVVPAVLEQKEVRATVQTIGFSVEGRKIESYTYGDGPTHLVFVGGIHGGYEWNSVILAYTFIDYLENNKESIPKNLTIQVIPSANPDGVHKVTGKDGRFTVADVSPDKKVQASGRFNANGVDINRNFNCNWKPEGTWQSKKVSAGTAPFSEPEARVLRGFIFEQKPSAVIFWHSQSNAVYASQCFGGILPETIKIMNAYSEASGYPAVKSFDAYEVNGAIEDWLASINIPAITVELKTHETVEWEKNLAGVLALIKYYGK